MALLFYKFNDVLDAAIEVFADNRDCIERYRSICVDTRHCIAC